MDHRVIGEQSDAVLRTAMPDGDEEEVLFDMAACKTRAHSRRENDTARVTQFFSFPQGEGAQ
jgi:hypothetical protein